MAGVRIAAVRVGVDTDRGSFGREVDFTPGLNIIRGSNNRGKTQIIQAIIYGLGLERMLNARANAPLGSVFTTELIESDLAQAPIPVRSSWVEVELVKSTGAGFTARRYIMDPVRKQEVIRVTHFDGESDPAAGRVEDMFLHRQGSASRASGFHFFLEQFLDWELPDVATFAKPMVKQYLDTLFPFMIVDQQAWGSVAPRKLNRYQIKDLSRKSVEYLLALTGPLAEMERNRLESELAELVVQWTANVRSMQTLTSASGGRLVGLPALPSGAHRGGTEIAPTVVDGINVELLEIDQWVSLEAYRAVRRSELEALRATLARGAKPADDRDSYVQKRIDDTEQAIDDVLTSLQLIQQDLGLSDARLGSLDARLGSLEDERLRNVDLRTLERLGSEMEADHLAHHNCPTCQQSLDGVESERPETVLGIEDTVALLNAQLLTTKKMKDRSQIVATQLADAEAGLARRLDGLRLELRSLQADQRAPRNVSEGDVARKVTTEIRLSELSRLQDKVDASREEFALLASAIAELRQSISSIEDRGSDQDTVRLRLVAERVQALLSKWGFGSYAESKIELDADDLVPARDGFDLNVDVSASDVVRIKIAYLEAMREVGSAEGHHLGLLVLDEPRQQDLDYADFASILQTLASESASGQVIVSTSSSASELQSILSGYEVNLVDIGGSRLLQRLEPRND